MTTNNHQHELLYLIKNGTPSQVQQACTQMYNAYKHALMKVIRYHAFGYSHEQCEEILQDVFLGFFNDVKNGNYKTERGTPYNYIVQKIRWKIKDCAREKKYVSTTPMDTYALAKTNGVNPEKILISKDSLEHVKMAIEKLPIEQKEVVTLYYFGGKTLPEISKEIGYPPHTVNNLKYKGMQKIRAAS